MAKTFSMTMNLIGKRLVALAEKIQTNDAQALAYEESAKIHRITSGKLRAEYEELQAAHRLLDGAFDSSDQVAERDPNG